MRKRGKSTRGRDRERQRIVLLVDGDGLYADTLRSAWSKLQVAEVLRVVPTREKALNFLSRSVNKNGSAALASVVLDPDTTGEDTGAFLREVKRLCGKDGVPALFWTRDGQKYEVLEGRGVDSVLKKPSILSLVQALDEVCLLNKNSFACSACRGSVKHNAIRIPE